MKKIRSKIVTLPIIATLMTGSLYAYSSEERVADMRQMEMAVQQMQKGFLYNNLQDIQKEG